MAAQCLYNILAAVREMAAQFDSVATNASINNFVLVTRARNYGPFKQEQN
jgi:hypothetical protein